MLSEDVTTGIHTSKMYILSPTGLTMQSKNLYIVYWVISFWTSCRPISVAPDWTSRQFSVSGSQD